MTASVHCGWQYLRAFVLVASGMLLAACGGGGGGDAGVGGSPAPTTLSGTAAAGAPIIGTVTVKDSSPSPVVRTTTIAADGRYTVDVSGMTPPFMLRADGRVGGRNYSLYSAATSADVGGNINVTPLTDLIVANVAGQIAANVYASGNFSGLTPAALASATATLRERLQPVLSAVGVAGAVDLLRASFAADHSGLDAALDAIRVEVDPATVTATITNLIDNQRITDDLRSRSDASILPATNVAAGVGEFQQIVATTDAFSALFATSMPAADNPTLLALLTDDFLFDGQDRDAFLSEITSDNLVGLRVTVLALRPGSILPAGAPTAATVEVEITSNSVVFRTTFDMKKQGGIWRIAGNGRVALAEVFTFARMQDVFVNGQLQPNRIDSGLVFEIKDEGGIGISHAIVKGKGLPAEGVLYVNYTRNSSFGVAAMPYQGEATPRLFQNGHNQVPLADGVITTLADNETYTVELWKDNGTPTNAADDVKLVTYTAAITKRPYQVSELGVSSFAAVSVPTRAQLRAFADNGGTITAAWTLPAGTRAVDLHFFRSGSLGGFDTVDVDLAPTATSATLSIGPRASTFGTVQGAGFNLFVQDAFGRDLVTIYNAD